MFLIKEILISDGITTFERIEIEYEYEQRVETKGIDEKGIPHLIDLLFLTSYCFFVYI